MKIFMNTSRWVVTFFFGLLLALFCAAMGPIDRSRKTQLYACYYVIKGLLRLAGIRISTQDLDQIDLKRNYIVCSNHQGMIDIFAIMGSLRLPLRFVSKPAYFKYPIIGWGMRGAGHIEITRTDKEKDKETLDRLVEIVKQGDSIVMFPEGTRSRDGSIGPFKYGTFYIAVQSGIPILPITIRGSHETMQKGSLFPKPGLVSLTFHKPIDPKNHTVDSLQETTRNQIVSAFA